MKESHLNAPESVFAYFQTIATPGRQLNFLVAAIENILGVLPESNPAVDSLRAAATSITCGTYDDALAEVEAVLRRNDLRGTHKGEFSVILLKGVQMALQALKTTTPKFQ